MQEECQELLVLEECQELLVQEVQEAPEELVEQVLNKIHLQPSAVVVSVEWIQL